MPITDLLSKIPFSPAERSGGAQRGRPSGPARPAGPRQTFRLELPAHAAPAAAPAAIAMDDPPAPALPPLPSYGVATIGGLSLACLALATALGIALSTSPDAATAGPTVPPAVSERPAAAAEPPAAAAFPADPVPIPVETITQLEAASELPVEVELSHLLGAVQYGFGAQSARLEPTLHSYVDRMAARFSWSPGTYRVAVTAPSAELADARAALLLRLFEDAAGAGRLHVRTGIGPHALTLVSD